VAPRYRVGRVLLDHDTPNEREADVSQDGRFELIAIEPGEHSLTLGPSRKLSLRLAEGEALELGELKPAESATAHSPP
jgi:hypothetical protein